MEINEDMNLIVIKYIDEEERENEENDNGDNDDDKEDGEVRASRKLKIPNF